MFAFHFMIIGITDFKVRTKNNKIKISINSTDKRRIVRVAGLTCM